MSKCKCFSSNVTETSQTPIILPQNISSFCPDGPGSNQHVNSGVFHLSWSLEGTTLRAGVIDLLQLSEPLNMDVDQHV